jgi:hypothetical protein
MHGSLLWSRGYGTSGTNPLLRLAGNGQGHVALLGSAAGPITFASASADGGIAATSFLAMLRAP